METTKEARREMIVELERRARESQLTYEAMVASHQRRAEAITSLTVAICNKMLADAYISMWKYKKREP